MNILLAPLLVFFIIFSVSMALTATIARAKGLSWRKWGLVGLLLPFYSILLVLLFPKNNGETGA